MEPAGLRTQGVPLPTEERVADANGLEIAYDEIGDPDGEPLILIMGLATQMIHWDLAFCAMLADRGYRVIRFDNRDIGRSTQDRCAGARHGDDAAGHRHVRPIASPTWPPTRSACSTISAIERAHVVGASMGGMIAQTVAIEHPRATFDRCAR